MKLENKAPRNYIAYDVVLKAYTDTEINGVKVKEGQVIGRFDKI